MITSLFAYGTLMPGQPRWDELERWCCPGSARATTAGGAIFRTPYGWPAAVFDRTAGTTIPGVRVHLHEATLDDALQRLDDIEGVASNLFDRITVILTCGAVAWAFAWPHPTEGFEPIEAWVP